MFKELDWFKVILVVWAIVFGILILTTNCKSAEAKNQLPPCPRAFPCDIDPIEDPIDPEPSSSGHSSSGSYVRKVTDVTYDQVKFGDRSIAVMYFQQMLNRNGAKLVVDGIYGKLTQSAYDLYKLTLWSIQNATK
jgi:hypothetical protein